jgi:hypothetical protein
MFSSGKTSAKSKVLLPVRLVPHLQDILYWIRLEEFLSFLTRAPEGAD